MNSNLTYLNRGYDRTLLLVPGWGFDERVFEPVHMPFNYLLYTSPDMTVLEDVVLSGGYGALDMMGWSQGGVALAGLAAKYPEQVGQLTLVGIRPAYPVNGLNEIKDLLARSCQTYLKCFYKACLDKTHLPWFKQTLQKTYLAKFETEDLLAGLDWLAQVSLDVAALKKIKSVTLIHGANDQVAPVQEARALAEQLPGARYCEVPDAAHAVFLHEAFSENVTVERQEDKKVRR
jgi:pimeloyl-ACP methyl ester carboxylesterase